MTRKMFFIELGNKRAQMAWLMIGKLSCKTVLNEFSEQKSLYDIILHFDKFQYNKSKTYSMIGIYLIILLCTSRCYQFQNLKLPPKANSIVPFGEPLFLTFDCSITTILLTDYIPLFLYISVRCNILMIIIYYTLENR